MDLELLYYVFIGYFIIIFNLKYVNKFDLLQLVIMNFADITIFITVNLFYY